MLSLKTSVETDVVYMLIKHSSFVNDNGSPLHLAQMILFFVAWRMYVVVKDPIPPIIVLSSIESMRS